jgi:phospholipid-binding lipoprotein MlaA
MKRQAPMAAGNRAGAVSCCCGAGMLGGCASTPDAIRERATPTTPLEPLNRKVFAFNMAADRMVLRPVARGYDNGRAAAGQSGVANFIDNLARRSGR